MANWEKLDREFYDVVNRLSDEQWHNWKEQQYHNRILRKIQKEMELQLHLLKLSYKPLQGDVLTSHSTVGNLEFSSINKLRVINTLDKKPVVDYSLAA